MKKFLGFIFALLLTISLQSCTTCSSTKVTDPVKPQVELVSDSVISMDAVENIISTDREAMFLKFGKNYRWYETDILLPEFLDNDSVTPNIAMLVNIFQSIVENGADTYVWKFQHFPDGTVVKDSIHGFWIENWALNEEALKLKYKDAYDRMMQTNFKKPHSRHVTLRNPVGPVYVNTQWIFGNIKEQIWVDAVTGNTTDWNPAFPKEKGFKMPLGEWP